MNAEQTATLAGGCFWCLEACFLGVQGVASVRSGYMGGYRDHPTYEEVCRGETGHAEVVQITFDPTMASYRDLLEIFFAIHDPTTPNRQGNDVGTQYRSAIYWHTPDQKREAEAMMSRLAAEHAFDAPIVTEITEAGRFWPAEAYHQDYFHQHPRQAYCQLVVGPKVARMRELFADRLKPAT